MRSNSTSIQNNVAAGGRHPVIAALAGKACLSEAIAQPARDSGRFFILPALVPLITVVTTSCNHRSTNNVIDLQGRAIVARCGTCSHAKTAARIAPDGRTVDGGVAPAGLAATEPAAGKRVFNT